jgi:lipopolysaccharide biosynthesis regulator YciM
MSTKSIEAENKRRIEWIYIIMECFKKDAESLNINSMDKCREDIKKELELVKYNCELIIKKRERERENNTKKSRLLKLQRVYPDNKECGQINIMSESISHMELDLERKVKILQNLLEVR